MIESGQRKIIKLSVGGLKYETTVETLTKDLGSVFAKFFIQGEKHPDFIMTAQGTLFIDRDGSLFNYILNYLRDTKILLPFSYETRRSLFDEA
jgi:hypothetical protein